VAPRLTRRADRGARRTARTGAVAAALGTTTLLVPRVDAAAVYFLAGAWVAIASLLPQRGRSMQESKSMRLDGKVVIVTGAGNPGQVGWMIAQRCIAAGARVVITARSPDVASAAAALGPGDVVAGVPADLTVPADLDRLAAAVRERFGRLDVLVNGAGGLTLIKPLAETSPEEWRREFEQRRPCTHRGPCCPCP
jgi:NADPH:quinone reductase-like Zn-dependent oxidoreductase